MLTAGHSLKPAPTEEKTKEKPGVPVLTAKKYMCVNPYEGFVCKRDGNHAGVAMPNFRTCYAIIVITANSLLALHYPSRVYSRQLPHDLKKWQAVFNEKIEKALIVLNKNYDSWGSITDKSIVSFQAQLTKDLGIQFNVIEAEGLLGKDLLIVNAADATVSLRDNDMLTNKVDYANWPRHPASRLRYYTCRAQFYTKYDDFPVMIVGSKNFFAPIDQKEWPACIRENVNLLRQKKDAVQTIGLGLIKASTDKTNGLYPWAIAIGLEGADLPNNLKHYLFLLLSLMHSVDKTVEVEPIKQQVETIEKTLGVSYSR